MPENIRAALMEAIAAKLEEIIDDKKDKTGKDLADLLVVSEATISLAKNGKRLLELEHIIRLCRQYEVSVDDFLDLQIVKKSFERGESSKIRWQVNKPKRFLQSETDVGIQLFEDGVRHLEDPSTPEWSNQYKSLHSGDGLHKLDIALRSNIIQLVDVPRDISAESDIKARFRWLREVKVIKLACNNGIYSNADTIKAECAAFLACQAINSKNMDLNGASVALGQGYAVRRMAAQLPHYSEKYNSEVFKGTKWVSTISERVRGYAFSNHTASSIVSELAWRYPSSEAIYLPYVTSNALKDHIRWKAIEAIVAAKVFFTTISSLKIDDFHRRGEREPLGITDLLDTIRENEALKSEAVTLYQDKILNANGEIINDPNIADIIKDTAYSIGQNNIDKIGELYNTWLLAVGAHKRAPVLSVLRSPTHLINSLIIDSEIAEYVIKHTPIGKASTLLEATF